eukprot:6458338-Amphidinium_carterae.1
MDRASINPSKLESKFLSNPVGNMSSAWEDLLYVKWCVCGSAHDLLRSVDSDHGDTHGALVGSSWVRTTDLRFFITDFNIN